jgi:hypothetical protein
MKVIYQLKGDISLLTDAGINWMLLDVPWDNGTVSQQYTAFKARVATIRKMNIRAILLPSFHSRFIEHSIEVTVKDGLLRAADVSVFLVANVFCQAIAYMIST